MQRIVPVLATLLTGLVGGLVFHAIGAPAAFLTGSAVAVALASVAGLKTALPDTLRGLGLAFIGCLMGANVSPEALAGVAALPVGVVGLALATGGAIVASYLVLRRLAGWDALSAMCGSIPGAFGLVIALSTEHGARMERVITAQALRLFILVSIVPLAFGGSGGDGRPVIEASGSSLTDLALAFAIALGSWWLAGVARVPAATMILPLVVSAILSGSGLVTLDLPTWLGAAAFTILGTSVAARFQRVTRAELLRLAGASLAAFVAAFTVSITLSLAFARLLGEPLGTVFLAYAPGGVDVMIALSFLLGFDVAFVTVMHVARLVLLSAASPFLINWAHRSSDRQQRSSP